MTRCAVIFLVSVIVGSPVLAQAESRDDRDVVLRVEGNSAASQRAAASSITTTRSGLAPGSTVIELKCGWQRSGHGTDNLIGSCEPPPCPGGWIDLGPLSCGANGVECVEGCIAVGACSRFCAN